MKVTLLLIAVFLFGYTQQANSQWIQCKGSLREVVSALTISGTNILAGTTERGVYLSTDSGASWTLLGFSLDNNTINALAISDSNFIAGTYEGIYFSTNKGANWTRGAITIGVNALLISGKILFAGADNGLYLSTDNGISWSETDLSNVGISCLAVSGANLYAGTGKGIFRSTDNGISWTKTNFYSDIVTSLAVSGTNLFAVIDYSAIYRSTDNGTSWNKMDSGLNIPTAYIRYIKAVVVSETNIFAATTNGLFQSTNYGNSWSHLSDSSKFSSVGAVVVLGSNLFAGTHNGVFFSTNNGTTWRQDNELPLNSAVFALDFLGKNIIAGAYRNNGNKVGGGIFFSSDYGIHWTQTNLLHETVWALAVLGTNLFAGTDSGIFLSDDNGISWTQAGLTPRHVNGIVVSGTNLFACTDSGLFLSSDNGVSWPQRALQNFQVNAFAIVDTTMCAGTDEGIFLSIDKGNSWTQTGLSATTVTSLAVLGTNLLAGTDYGTGGIHLSTDNGFSWKTVNTGLPNNGNIYVISLAVSGSNLFLGTVSYGVFLSTDTGRSWINMDLGDYDVHALAILGTEIYAGTYGTSIWRRSFSEMIPSEVKTSTNSHVSRLKNIPNPFDATTKITFDLERSAFVSLKIFDILGREISVLVSEELPAGSYSRDWNASGFPPGEYFYRLQAGASSETNKLMLVK